jgi:hypothetical protein
MKTNVMQANASTNSMSPAVLAEALGSLLRDFTDVYERLAASVAGHREAIRRADAKAIAAATNEQQRLTRDAAACDQRRRELVARSVRAFATLAGTPVEKVTLSDLAKCTPGDVRGKLAAAAATLRALVTRVSQEAASLRSATMTLMAHMEGMVRQVGKTLSHAGTYSRRGVVEAGGVGGGAGDLAGEPQSEKL